MASQSLYRKWRSQTFSDLVGQESVVRTLKNAIKSGSLGHAYLFAGPRGTGKTSTARLLAKTINCPNSKDSEPCNECQQCREITAGNSFNVIEIDAASNRGIDSIRELREKVMMPPSTGKYKVYILDEAHMLTTEAFNALLKTLEEPPRHAVFIMATTDVHKMLPTVLSRCQRFDFKRITTRQIVEHLRFVAEQEQVKLERGASELIARAAAGGMRDALSLLDQAIAYAGQEVSLAQVQTMLGIADPHAIQKIIAHVAHLDSAAGLHMIHELAADGADLRQINMQVAEYWRAMVLTKAGANVAVILDSTEDEIREIEQMAQFFKLEELTEYARIFAQNELMQKNQGTPQLGLELALLSCIELHRGIRVVSVQSHTTARQEQPVAQEATPRWENVACQKHEEQRTAPPSSTTAPTSDVPVESPRSATSPVEDTRRTLSLTVEQVKEKWELIKRRIKTKKDGGKITAILNSCTIINVEENADIPVVTIKAPGDFHYKSLQKTESCEIIEWALKVELGQECKIRLLSPDQTPDRSISIPPPVSQDSGPSMPTTEMAALAKPRTVRENAAIGETRQETIEKKVANDPVVKKVVEMFKAEIKDIQLR